MGVAGRELNKRKDRLHTHILQHTYKHTHTHTPVGGSNTQHGEQALVELERLCCFDGRRGMDAASVRCEWQLMLPLAPARAGHGCPACRTVAADCTAEETFHASFALT